MAIMQLNVGERGSPTHDLSLVEKTGARLFLKSLKNLLGN